MNDCWGTPQALFDKLNAEFHFVLDVCALPENAKCAEYFSPATDGLTRRWVTRCYSESVWMNPPYGRGIERWVQKAYEESTAGVRVVALIPARTNAPWWHDYVMRAREIRFVRRKVSFEGTVDGVPFWGSAIAVFGPGITHGAPTVSSYEQPPRIRPLSAASRVSPRTPPERSPARTSAPASPPATSPSQSDAP